MADETGTSGWPAPPIEKQRAARRGTEPTSEQVAEIRRQYATWQPPEGAVIRKLADTIVALREQLREAPLTESASYLVINANELQRFDPANSERIRRCAAALRALAEIGESDG